MSDMGLREYTNDMRTRARTLSEDSDTYVSHTCSCLPPQPIHILIDLPLATVGAEASHWSRIDDANETRRPRDNPQ